MVSKKIVLAALFALILSSNTVASVELESTANPYETLLQWFAEGEPVEFSEAKKYFAGRCFVKEKRTSQIVFGAGLYNRSEHLDHGPGFPSQSPGRLGLALDQNPVYYDSRSDKASSADYEWETGSKLVLTPHLHWFYDMEPNGRPDFKFELLKRGDFLVMKVTNLIGQNLLRFLGLKGHYKAGQTVYACYFFKPGQQ